MTKYMEWDEPFNRTGCHVICRMTFDDVIKAMKELQEDHKDHPNYPYKTDQEALDDFQTIHWARIIDAD
jgi:hypothetical protein